MYFLVRMYTNQFVYVYTTSSSKYAYNLTYFHEKYMDKQA